MTWEKIKKQGRILTLVWLVLMGLTLLSALIAEQADPTVLIVMLICATVAIKGSLVIERLMGLRTAVPGIRWVMLSYFFVLPPIIAFAVVFPETLAQLTSL